MKPADLWKKWYFRLPFEVVLAVLIAAAAGYVFMDRLLFPAPFTGKKVGNVTLSSGNAVLDAVWIRTDDPRATVLFSHGNGEHLAMIRPWLDEFTRHGYNILAYDYAGYGGSTGKAGAKQACRDIEAAYRFLTGTEKIPPERIIALGFSVGSGPSVHLASKYPVGLVLAAPFASAAQVVLPFSPPADRLCNADSLARSEIPVLIFHGTADRVIPFRNAQKIFDRAAGRKKLIPVPGADHDDLFDRLGDRFWTELDAFFPR